MIFSINEKIFELFPDLILGIIVAKNIDNQKDNAVIKQKLAEQEKLLTQRITGELSEHPQIIAWREAHKRFGAKPKNYPSSIEALTKRVLKGENIPNINNLVNLYNAVSLKYLIPVGGEDLDKIMGNIQLTMATGQEEFMAVSETENRPPRPGEIIYKDEQGVICRRFNWRESDRTKFTKKTRNAILVIERLPPTSQENANQAIHELADDIQKYCLAETSIYLLDKNNQTINLN